MRNTDKPGLTVEVMGWTGPLGQGWTEYKVSNSFPSEGDDTVTIVGSNKTEPFIRGTFRRSRPTAPSKPPSPPPGNFH